MTFVTAGLAIAGVLAVAIPIIIHLLWRQRRQPVEWAAMRFLLEAFRKQKRRLQVEQVLLLLVRCLIVAILGIALARPLLQAAGVISAGEQRIVLLVIDNGLASAVAAEESEMVPRRADGTALARHRRAAIEIIESLGDAEAVGIITTARPATAPVMPPSINHGAVIDVIRGIEPSEAGSDLPAALRIAREHHDELRADGRSVVIYLLSEFRAGSAAIDSPLPRLFEDAGDQVRLLASPPATQTRANVQVVGVDPVRHVVLPGSADGANQVTVRLERHGGTLDAGTSRISLASEDFGRIEPRSVRWQPGQAGASVTFDVPHMDGKSGPVGLSAIIDDDDALVQDNARHTVIDVRERLRIAMVGLPTFFARDALETLTPGQWIRWALQPTDVGPMDLVDVLPSALTEVDLRNVDVAIVMLPDRLGDAGWRALRAFVDGGGLVVLTPPAESNVHPWTDRLVTDMGLPWRIELEVVDHPTPRLFADDQPRAELLRLLAGEFSYLLSTVTFSRTLPVNSSATQAEVILRFDDSSPALIAGVPGSARGSSDGEDAMDESSGESSGLVVYLAAAPRRDWTTLPISSLMVPLFQETVRQGVSLIRAGQRISVGEQPTIVGISSSTTALVDREGRRITVERRRPQQPFTRAGLYDARDAAGNLLGRVAVNIDARAARIDVQSGAAVAAWLGQSGPWTTFDPEDPAAAMAAVEGGFSLAKYLLIALLVLVVLETILARRFSHAYREPQTTGLSGGLRPTLADTRT